MRKTSKKKFLIFTVSLCVVALFVFATAYSEVPDVIAIESTDYELEVIDNGLRENDQREIMINVNNIKPGKRITGFEICNQDADCDDNANWTLLNEYVSPHINSVGTNDMTIGLMVPADKIKIRPTFADFEPMDISYAKYNLSTTDENEYRSVYVNGMRERENYDSEFTNVVTGYKGGDIILPSGCTSNGCLLKVTLKTDDYNAIMDRLNDFNQNHNIDDEDHTFLDLAGMNNHLSDIPTDSIIAAEDNNGLIIESGENTKSFYLVVNRFFSEKNRADIVIGENGNRILSEDYIGLKYKVDRKYFDEGNNYGFLTFNEFNEYKQGATIFYGTPEIQLGVDSVRPLSLADGGSSNMGTIKNVYTNIVSGDQDKYPISNSYMLTIKSFYEQDYVVPIVLKNGNTTVKNVELNLSRFAFGGNAGSLLLVDGDGINCRQSWMHPNCTGDNIYVSTEYRGLYDTFYSNGDTVKINTFEISNQQQGLTGDAKQDLTVYERNEDFNPWAVAIFYRNDEIVATKSFDLGSLVKVEGFNDEVISNDIVNGKAKTFGGDIITDYNSNDYTVFGYGLGFEKPINRIKYFSEGSYHGGNITHTLILASKKELLDNNINRIALFLTNGELKSDEENFPELTYGVGEGKIFEVDGRTFDELGGGE